MLALQHGLVALVGHGHGETEQPTRLILGLDGSETFSLTGLGGEVRPRMDVTLTITKPDGSTTSRPQAINYRLVAFKASASFATIGRAQWMTSSAGNSDSTRSAS